MGNHFFVANASERPAFARISQEKHPVIKDLTLSSAQAEVKMIGDGFTLIRPGEEYRFGKKIRHMYLTILNDEQYIICKNYLLPRKHSAIVTPEKDVNLSLTFGDHWRTKKTQLYRVSDDGKTEIITVDELPPMYPRKVITMNEEAYNMIKDGLHLEEAPAHKLIEWLNQYDSGSIDIQDVEDYRDKIKKVFEALIPILRGLDDGRHRFNVKDVTKILAKDQDPFKFTESEIEELLTSFVKTENNGMLDATPFFDIYK